MKTAIAGFSILAITLLAQGRVILFCPYQELYDTSDLVVIAKPLCTQDTKEQTVCPEVMPNPPVVGLSTEFDIRLVMKGDKNLKMVVLHHYRHANPQDAEAYGWLFATFDPKQKTDCVMFLCRESDGRYAPACGQTDITAVSILKLGGLPR